MAGMQFLLSYSPIDLSRPSTQFSKKDFTTPIQTDRIILRVANQLKLSSCVCALLMSRLQDILLCVCVCVLFVKVVPQHNIRQSLPNMQGLLTQCLTHPIMS